MMPTGQLDEAPIWIRINGVRRVVLTCSPADPYALGLGHLLAEGWIRDGGSVRSAAVHDGPGGSRGVAFETDPAQVAAAEALRRHQVAHGCGLRHFLDCEPLRPRQAAAAPPASGLADVFRGLFAVADDAAPAGGIHAAALTDGIALLHASVDVARHCAVDRVLGAALRDGTDTRLLGLVATSRISGAIALKAIRGGVAWVASRSLGTPLARELAAAAALAIHEHAARRERRGEHG
jgi:FdhD protein